LRIDSPAKPLDWVKAHYDSPRGRIESEWRQMAGRFQSRVVVPANATAVVTLPADSSPDLLVGGKPLNKNSPIKIVGKDANHITLEVPSGHYAFSTRRSLD